MKRVLRLIGAGVGAAACLLFAAGAWAQAAYPAKPIRLIVPWPPGGGADVLSRMLSPTLSQALGQQIIIDNRGGAAGNIGAEMAARSPADGYTMVFAYSGTHSINPLIYAKMPFRESDFSPLIWLASVPQVVVVHPSLPVKNVKDLIALDKAKPGQLSFGSSGNGAINHLAGVPGYDVTSWNGMLAPAGTPPDVVRRLNTEYNKIISDPEMRKRMIANGYEPIGGPPEKFGEHIRAELAKWAPVVKRANIKVD